MYRMKKWAQHFYHWWKNTLMTKWLWQSCPIRLRVGFRRSARNLRASFHNKSQSEFFVMWSTLAPQILTTQLGCLVGPSKSCRNILYSTRVLFEPIHFLRRIRRSLGTAILDWVPFRPRKSVDSQTIFCASLLPSVQIRDISEISFNLVVKTNCFCSRFDL